MTVSHLTESIQANVTYWYKQVTQSREQDLKQERHNLFLAVQYGLQLPAAYATTVKLVLAMLPLIEWLGGWSEWIPHVKRALASCPQTELSHRINLMAQLGHLYKLNRQLEKALQIHQQAELLAHRLEDKRLLAKIYSHLCIDYRNLRQYEDAQQYGEKALSLLQVLPEEKQLRAATLMTLGLVAHAFGQHDKAITIFTQTVTCWQTLNEPTYQARALKNMANVLVEQGQLDRAQLHYTEASDLLDKTSSELDKIGVLVSLGTLFANQERWQQAEKTFRQAYTPYLRQSGDYHQQALLAHNLGEVIYQQKRFNESEDWLRRSLELWQQAEDTLIAAYSRAMLGRTLAAQGQLHEARDLYDKALTGLSHHKNDTWAQKWIKQVEALRQSIQQDPGGDQLG